MKQKFTMKFHSCWVVFFYFALNLLPQQILAQGFIESSTYIPKYSIVVSGSEVVNGESYTLDLINDGGIVFSRITKTGAAGNIIWTRNINNLSGYLSKIKVVNGSVYLIGSTSSATYPVTNGSTRLPLPGPTAVYTKLDASTGAIQFSTYLNARGELYYIDVVDGAVYMAGNSYQSSVNQDILVVKYDDVTNSPLFISTIGSSGSDAYSRDDLFGRPQCQIVDNKIYLAVSSRSADFPVTDGSVATNNGGNVILKMDAITGSVDFASYFGGKESLQIVDLKVADGGVYIVGETDDSGLPVTDGSVYKGGNGDGYITKFNSSSGAVEFSKYIGSSGKDEVTGIELQNGVIYVVTSSSSLTSADVTNFPITSGSTTAKASGDIAFTKMDKTTGDILYSRFITSLGGGESAFDIRLVDGELYIVGLTSGSDYPVTNSSVLLGGTDFYITKIGTDNKICFSSFLGGAGGEYDVVKLQVEDGKVYLAGITYSNDFPVTNGSGLLIGGQELFVTVFNLANPLVSGDDNTLPASQWFVRMVLHRKLKVLQ